jgi:hypothetical protein
MHTMRLTQYRVSAMPASDGLVSLSLLKVDYDGGKVVGHDVVLNDWCEPGQLQQLAAQFLQELASQVYRDSAFANGVSPLRIVPDEV